ncbi:hypothetical protein IWX62_003170 [Arthrobacter sp. CAN_A1]
MIFKYSIVKSQIVGYVGDLNGCLVEICSPIEG